MRDDLRQALRMLRQSPAHCAIVVLTLGLAIGANTAIFSVVNGLMLRTLAIAEPDRLVTISSDAAIARGFKAGLGWNAAMWEYLRDREDAFGGALAWSLERLNFQQGGGETQPIDVLHTSGSFFPTLGVRPVIGRLLAPTDDVRGGGREGPAAVISYNTWQRRYGASPSVIGTPLVLEGVPFTIVGVTGPEFSGIEVGRGFDAAIPLGTEPMLRRDGRSRFSNYLLIIMLRLKPDQSLESATATIRAMQPLMPGYGKGPKLLHEPYVLQPAAEGTSGYGGVGTGLRQQYERPLLTILVLVGVVLLVACVNIANLQLTRATARRHELSLRAALGAPRWRIARLLLAEGVVLAGLGAIVGLPFAMWGSRQLVAQLSRWDVPVLLDLSLDYGVLAFTAAASMATAMLVTIAPAFRATRADPIEALKEHAPGAGRASGGDRTGVTLTNALLVAQMALSLILVVAAGLLVATFVRMIRAPLGFDSERILIAQVDTGRAHQDHATRNAFYHRVVDTIAAVPGVAHAAGSGLTPLGEGTRAPILNEPGRILTLPVSPGYFATYGTTLHAGRDFTAADASGSMPVAIANEAYVRQHLAGRAPLGVVVEKRTIVGVAGDAVFSSVRGGMRPTLYVPMRQSEMGPPSRTAFSVSIRAASGSPSALAPSIASALSAMNSALSFTFRPLDGDVRDARMTERVVAMMSGFFAALVLLLAGLGLYGVTSYAVTRRRHEIGIRMALGAERSHILALVLRRSAMMTGIGVVLGLGGAALLARYLEAMLFGVRPLDPETFAAVAALFGAVTTIAALVPARRAASVDPLVAIRHE